MKRKIKKNPTPQWRKKLLEVSRYAFFIFYVFFLAVSVYGVSRFFDGETPSQALGGQK